MKMAQIEIVVSKEIAEKFKEIVFAKHGKLELGVEGEALKLYIQRYEYLLRKLSPSDDPLKDIIGIGSSFEKRNVLEDLERLETSP